MSVDPYWCEECGQIVYMCEYGNYTIKTSANTKAENAE